MQTKRSNVIIQKFQINWSSHPWEPKKFLTAWKNATNDLNEQKRLLRMVAEHNYYLISNGFLHSKSHWVEKFVYRKLTITPSWMGQIHFSSLTTDEAICENVIASTSNRVVALNFANAIIPGGGYLAGSDSQEEELHRQYPELYASLRRSSRSKSNPMYPIRPGEVLVTNNIRRLRQNRNHGYDLIDNPTITSGFVTAAAPNFHDWTGTENPFAQVKQSVENTLEAIFTAPKQSQANVLVIGAWGCGAAAPRDEKIRTAYIHDMASAIAVSTMKNRHFYDVITVAIPDIDSQNYQIFYKTFKQYGLI